jgi:hypothetical protein
VLVSYSYLTVTQGFVGVILSICQSPQPFCLSVGSSPALEVINDYWYGTGGCMIGDTFLFIQPRNGTNRTLAPADKILIIQMQDGTYQNTNDTFYGANTGTGTGYLSVDNAGVFEFTNVLAYDPITGVLEVSPPLENNYFTNILGPIDLMQTFQVVRVPVCFDMQLQGDIQCAPWDGLTGGIIALIATKLTFAGNKISCNGGGFRGGYYDSQGNLNNDESYVSTSQFDCGRKGEGFCGSPQFVHNLTSGGASGPYPSYNGDRCRGSPCNAGGGGNAVDTGGGGGSLAGAGGMGGVGPLGSSPGLGGVNMDSVLPQRMFMGEYPQNLKLYLKDIN